jgi:hypothetical protein
MAHMANENGVVCDSIEYEIVADRYHAPAWRVCIRSKALREPRQRIARVEHPFDQPARYFRLAAILRDMVINRIEVALRAP